MDLQEDAEECVRCVCRNACEDRIHGVGERPLYKEERDTFACGALAGTEGCGTDDFE